MNSTHRDLVQDLITLPAAANRLDLHRSTVNEMVHTGRLRGYRLGPHWYVRRSELEVFAQGYERPKNAPKRRSRQAQSFWTDEILRWLYLWRDATSYQLGQVLDLHVGNIRKYLTLAEKEGLVERDDCSNWSLTTKGQERASSLPIAGEAYSDSKFDALQQSS